MSITIEKIVGFTVTLKQDLTSKDFKFFHSLEDKYPDKFGYKGEYYDHPLKVGKTVLVVDGMSSEYARLVYIEKTSEVCIDEDEYLLLKEKPIPNEVYESINKAYKLIYGEPLDKSKIEYALWYYWW